MGKKIIAFGVVFLLSFVLISISNGTNGEYIGTETQITDSVEDQIYPTIYGDRIVWSGLYGGTRDIFVYNLSTNIEMRITRDIAGDYYPTIFGDIIVWYKINGANSNIYMYNISNNTEIQITNDPADQRNPAISPQWVSCVWGAVMTSPLAWASLPISLLAAKPWEMIIAT